MIDGSGIHLPQEAGRSFLIAGDDALSMMRAIVFNMFDSLLHTINNLHRQFQIKILGGPVALLRGNDIRHKLTGTLTTVDLHAALPQTLNGLWQPARRDGLMDQQGFSRVTDRWPLRLGIHSDIPGHLLISLRIDIDVAVAHASLDDRYSGLFNNRADKLRTATGNHQKIGRAS